MRTFEYRLYPTREQHGRLLACLRETRLLYNEMLARTKEQYEQTGIFLFKYDLCAVFKGRGTADVPASTVQTLADRLDKALRRYLDKNTHGQSGGFPRFKAANRWHSFQLRQYDADFRVSDDQRHLVVPGKLGRLIKIKLHRPFIGVPKTAYLVLRADNHWYALIVCVTPQVEEPPQDHEQPASEQGSIGLDVGLHNFVTDSQGGTVLHPRYLQQSLKTLRRK